LLDSKNQNLRANKSLNSKRQFDIMSILSEIRQVEMFFGNFEVSERTINVVITGEESVVWDNTVRYGTIKDIF